MLSEEFDKKIREAADHHHPAYDERAWRDMNRLLDKHMPADDRKRRWIFFLLFFLLLGAGITGLVNGWWTGYKGTAAPVAGTRNEKPGMPVGQDPHPVAAGSLAEKGYQSPASPAMNDRTVAGQTEEKQTLQNIPGTGLENKREAPAAEIYSQAARVKKTGNRRAPQNITGNPDPSPEKEPDNKYLAGRPDRRDPAAPEASNGNLTGNRSEEKRNTAALPVTDKAGTMLPAEKNKETVAAIQPAPVKEKRPAEKNEKKADIAKRKREGKNVFLLAASAGPDLSFTRGDAPGTVKIVGGGGIGYTFRDRFTLRTGFYSGRKIYTASADQYHGTPVFYQYYPNLQKVEADCKVNEIPFALSYHFGARGKRPFFVSAGLSSLIMKEETYTYYYKYNAAGPTVSRTHSTYNANRHFLSVATLSAGYQQRIGKRLMLIAEPYIKLPVSGVGNGKVMLNSTGIQFSVGFTPFTRKSAAGITQ